MPEVQRITTALDLGANEIQSITTAIEDINELQVIATSATAHGEVQRITVSPPPGESIVESAYTFAISLDTTSTGGSLQYSGQISATAAPDGSRASVRDVLGSMANVEEMPTVTKSTTNADGGHSYTVTFPPSMRNMPQMEVYVSDVPITIETVADGNVLDGTYRLEFDGQITEDIPADASPAIVQSRLENLSIIGGAVAVSRSDADDQGGYSWEIEFLSAKGNLPDLIPHGEGLTTTNDEVGGAAIVLDPSRGIDGSFIEGAFVLEFGEETTEPLPSDAGASTVREALESLSTIEKVDVERSDMDISGGFTWTIRFLEEGARIHRGDVPPLMIQSSLTGGGSTATPTVTVAEVRKGTSMEVQTIAITAGGASVDPMSTFRLSFRGEETNDIYALPAGGSTCLGSTAAKQIITTSTEDTTGEGGDDTVSHLTHFTLTYEGYTTAQIPANGIGLTCEDTAAAIAEELEQIPPLYSVSVAGGDSIGDSGDEGCFWVVTLESVVGNPELLQVTAYHEDLSPVGPATSVTIGSMPSSIVRDTIAVSQPVEFQGDVDLIQSELSKLSTVGLVSVTADSIVPDAAGQCRWHVTFESNAGDLPPLEVAPGSTSSAGVGAAAFDSSAILNSGDTVMVTDNVVQGTSTTLSGDFTLSFDGEVTGYLPFDVSADAMKNALEGLDPIGKVEVERHGPDVNDCYTWDVTFTSDLGPLPVMVADGLDLEGTVASISVATHVVGVIPPFDGPDYGSVVLTDLDLDPLTTVVTVVSPLKQGIPYYFRVSAANALGSGPFVASKPTFEVPLPQPPSDPSHVGLEVKDGSTLTVTIDEPDHTGGESIDTYQVDYSTEPFQHEKQRISLTCSPEPESQTVTTHADDINEIQYLIIDSSYQGNGIIPETQRVTCDATGGTFGLTLVGLGAGARRARAGLDTEGITAFFPYDANADDIQQAFESLDGIDSVSIHVDTPNGAACAPYDGISAGSFTVTFHSLVDLAGNIPPLIPHTSSLEGARRIDVETVTDGDAPVEGTFRMSFRGALSDPVDITHGASSSSSLDDLASAIQTALEDVDTIENGGVVVSAVPLPNGGEESIFVVEFVGSGVGGDVVAIEIPHEHNLLRGSDAEIYVVADGERYTARNTVDTVTSRVGNVLSGSFRLRLRGHTTDDIPFNASEDDVKARLEELPNVGTVDVQVGSPTNERGYTWTITFVSNPGYFPPTTRDVDALQYISALSTSVDSDSSANISVNAIRQGDERLDGTFQLTFTSSDGDLMTTTETTLPLNAFASEGDMKSQLELLPNVGRVHVQRTQSDVGYEWDVEFVGCALKEANAGANPGGIVVCNDGNLLPLVATSINLAGCGGATLQVTELQAGSGASDCPQFASGKCTQVHSVLEEYPFVHEIVGLDLGTPYYVQVRLGNSQSYGYRRLSTPLSASPHHGPPGAPPPVILMESTSTSLTLAWEPPTQNGGIQVSGYELWMDEWSGGSPYLVYDGSDDSTTLQYTLETTNVGPQSQIVEPGRQYRFQVRAINNCNTTDTDLACHGPFSDVQVFTVREPRRPLAPSAPERDARTGMTSSSSASITVTWSRPIDNGGSPITGYVLYMKHPDGNIESYPLGANDHSYSVDDLAAGETYRFHLVAINVIGRSGNSPVLSVIAAMPPGMGDTTLEPTYSTVASYRPTIADVKETEMVVEWSSPALDGIGGTPITGYKLYQYAGIGPNTKSNPEPIRQEVQDVLLILGDGANGGDGGIGGTESEGEVGGTFTLSFRGHETASIATDATANDVKYALQNLDSINVVAVEKLAVGQSGWRVRFLSEPGDLPLMQGTSGRLMTPNGASAKIIVEEHVKGDAASLVYDGTDQPSVRSFAVSNLFPGARYAYKVAPINAVGQGVLSLATTTTVARAGASAQQTTASGGALAAGIAGSIQEEQTVVFVSNDCNVDRLVLSFGNGGAASIFNPQTPNLCGSTASEFKTALQALPGVGTVDVSRRDVSTFGGSTGYAWSITFNSIMGDVPSMVVDTSQVQNGKDASDRSGPDAAYVSEFLRGQANEFIVEPKKASGAIVRDITASDGMAGQDLFFSELWTSNPSVVDGSHEWYSDGGLASYNPVQYEEQVIFVPSTFVGSFRLTMDTSPDKPKGRVGGHSATTVEIGGGDDAGIGANGQHITDLVLQDALSSLTNIGKVLVSSLITANGDAQYTVTFVTVLGELPLLTSSDSSIVISRAPHQIGLTEIQTITSSVDQAFVYEAQSIAVPSSASTFRLSFGTNSVTNPIACNFATLEAAQAAATIIKAELEATTSSANADVDGDGSHRDIVVSVDEKQVSGDGSDENPWVFVVTFVEPVGPLPLLWSDNAVIAQITQGHSTLEGTMVLSYDGEYTDDIAFDASAVTIKHRLEALSTIDEVDVHKIDKRTGYEWEVTFTRSVGNLPTIIAYPQVFEVQKIETVGGSPTPLGGFFQLLYRPDTTVPEMTSPLPFDATEEDVKAALETLPSISLVDVDRVSKANGQFEWFVTFRSFAPPHQHSAAASPHKLQLVSDGISGTLDAATVSVVVEVNPQSLVSSTGAHPTVAVEEKVAGLPSYTARYRADQVGEYSLAVLQLRSGGLNARYYDNQWLLEDPVVERVDESINFDWGSGPITPYGRDFVGVRWWGKIRPTTNEDYTFYVIADDAVRVYVNHMLLIDAWEDDSIQPGNEQRATVTLTKDHFHDLRVEYREETGLAYVQLQWSSSSIRKQPISPLLLYHSLHIAGSPFPVVVSPGAMDHVWSDLQGSDINETVAGEQTHFIIQAKDREGNVKIHDGTAQGDMASPSDQFSVDIVGGSMSVSGDVEYVGNGQYKVQYVIPKAGDYQVSVRTGDGRHIFCGMGEESKCSPFALTVRPGTTVPAVSEATSRALSTNGIVSATAGISGLIDVQAKDAYGNDQQEGGDDFVALFASADDDNLIYRGIVEDGGYGSYSITYSIPIAGDYRVSVGIGAGDGRDLQQVQQNVDTLRVGHAGLNGGGSVVTDIGDGVVGVESEIIIESRDAYGNLRTDNSDDVFVATLTGPGGYTVNATSSGGINGIYPIRYTLYYKGVYDLTVRAVTLPNTGGDGDVVSGSTYTINVEPGEVSAASSTAYGSGLRGGRAGDEAVFYIQARDVAQPTIQVIEAEPGLEGSFTLSIGEETTDDIAVDASAEELREAIEQQLREVRDVEVTRESTENSGHAWTVTYYEEVVDLTLT